MIDILSLVIALCVNSYCIMIPYSQGVEVRQFIVDGNTPPQYRGSICISNTKGVMKTFRLKGKEDKTTCELTQ